MITIDTGVVERIRNAWNRLDTDWQKRISPILEKAHAEALGVVKSNKAPEFGSAVPRQALLARSTILGDLDNILSSLKAGVVLDIGPLGEIWGTGKYEQLDPGWVESAAVWLENLLRDKHEFNNVPAVIEIPDTARVAIAGDWGAGHWDLSSKVAKGIDSLKPDVTIHLGDVYYSGDKPEESLFTELWPAGGLAVALNSNHEMYAGAHPYFAALARPPFNKQNECSFFALENKNWAIIGLDSAYYSDAAGLYLDGSLGAENYQLDFLKSRVDSGKKVIVLTHHNGLAEDGSDLTKLGGQVLSAFASDKGPVLWYWGHVHAAAAYKPYGKAEVRCRCCGHGGIPWGKARLLKQSKHVEWWENRLAKDSEMPNRVLNGFALLSLDGPRVQEIFYDENGKIAKEL